MQKLKERIERRFEVEEVKIEIEEVKIHVPTLKEKIERKLSDEEWMRICFEAKDKKCFREYSGHKICDLCPKNPKLAETNEKFQIY
jgi:hypothetical protein